MIHSHGCPASVRAAILAVVFILLNGSSQGMAQTTAQFQRGLSGTKSFQASGPALRAKVQRESESPLTVRVQAGSAPGSYEVRFIGNVPGTYDLRDYLECVDGSAAALPPLEIEIVSTLPKDQRSDLFEADSFEPSITGGYRLALGAVVLAWLAVPLWVIYRKVTAKQPIEVIDTAPVAVPLIDQIRPLVQAATRGELSIADQARLELLLLHYWREVEQLPQLNMAASIQQLRQHPQAGPMLAAVEAWLHGDASAATPESLRRALDLLEPMQTASAQSETRTLSETVGARSERI